MSDKKPNKMSEEQLARIKALTLDGVNPYQISKQLKISPSVAKYHATKFKGVKKPQLPELPIMDAYNEYKRENEMLRKKNKLLVEILTQQLQD